MLVKAGEEPDPRSLHTEDGGLRYEVVLEEARTKKMPRPKSAPSHSRNYQDIQTKLQVSSYSMKIRSAYFILNIHAKAAEERRKQFEAEQLSSLAARERRAEVVRSKRVTLDTASQ